MIVVRYPNDFRCFGKECVPLRTSVVFGLPTLLPKLARLMPVKREYSERTVHPPYTGTQEFPRYTLRRTASS